MVEENILIYIMSDRGMMIVRGIRINSQGDLGATSPGAESWREHRAGDVDRSQKGGSN